MEVCSAPLRRYMATPGLEDGQAPFPPPYNDLSALPHKPNPSASHTWAVRALQVRTGPERRRGGRPPHTGAHSLRLPLGLPSGPYGHAEGVWACGCACVWV